MTKAKIKSLWILVFLLAVWCLFRVKQKKKEVAELNSLSQADLPPTLSESDKVSQLDESQNEDFSGLFLNSNQYSIDTAVPQGVFAIRYKGKLLFNTVSSFKGYRCGKNKKDICTTFPGGPSLVLNREGLKSFPRGFVYTEHKSPNRSPRVKGN